MNVRSIVLILYLCGGSAAFPQKFVREARPDAVIEVDASKAASAPIPRTIYGTFLEPIGNSIYPGLWAQLLENPSFEDNLWSAAKLKAKLEHDPELVSASGTGLPLPWLPLDKTQGNRYEWRWDEAANSSRSVLIMALPGDKQTGVRQRIFLPVHRELRYRGYLYAKPFSGPKALDVSLRRESGEVLARQEISLNGPAWAKYEFAVQLKPGQLAPLEPCEFVIAASGETRVFVDQALLFPADAVDGMDPEMIAMSKALKSPVVRYGGNFTSGYHWRDGVGPMDKRRTMLNQAWGIPEYNHFGTDEFLRFCQLIGAEPQIALNLGTGTPEEAASWVRYVNAHWGDHRGGLLWELGNELWGTFQIGYPTIERIADRTRVFSDAVRKVDSRARLIGTGADPDHFADWNARQFANVPAIQYLSTHFVVPTASVVRHDASQEFKAETSFALPVGLENRLRAMHEQVEADPRARGKVKTAFTEWLFHGRDSNAPSFNNMGGAICAAGFLNTLIKVSDFTPVADMTGLVEFGGIWKKREKVYGVPAYYAFRMYSTADAVWPVASITTADGYDVHEGNRRISEIANVPYLDVVAALGANKDRLTLFCVNRHLERDIPARIRIAGFEAGSQARVQLLVARDIYQGNNEEHPEAVVPAQSTVAVDAAGLEYTFPHSSVAVIELRRK